jgi:hypothetical protein
MNDEKAKQIIDEIIGQIFGFQNPFSLEQFAAKFAFDIRQTVEVFDYKTGESTWAQNSKSNKYVKFANLSSSDDDSMIPKEAVNSIDDIVRIWQKTNVTAAERYLNCVDVAKSDAVYGCQNIYRCIDVHDSKNLVFSETSLNNEFSAAIQRSNNCVYSLRVDDSKQVSKSFQVSWSGNVSNCFFIKDSTNMSDCMFCSGVQNKRFCIANMQFEEAEYRKWEAVVKRWILSN